VTLEQGPHAADRLHALHRSMRDDVRTERALRLGLRAVKGLSEDDARRIVSRRNAPYTSLRDLWLRTELSPRVLERLADADAFGSLELTRRQALWAVKALGRAGDQDDLPLLGGAGAVFPASMAALPGGFSEPAVTLPPMSLGEEVVNDYRYLSLSLRRHPASFLRDDLARFRVVPNETLRTLKSGAYTRVSGLITVRQRPGSANGVIFMTIEDETAIANIIVWPPVFERFRAIVMGARYVAVTGRMQEESGVIHVVADRLEDLTSLLARLSEDAAPPEALARADAVKHPHAQDRAKPRPPGRIPPLHPRHEAAQIAADLGIHAHGSAHVPTRKASSK
jgi:error-prone DNA polymerase